MPKRLGRRPQTWKGVLGGLAGGLAATIVMTQFQNAWSKISETLQKEEEGRSLESREKEDATMKVAGKVANAVGHPLSHAQKKKAGPMIHYGFGTAMGGFYGLAKERIPTALSELHPLFSGLAFGTAIFLGGDEVAVPVLGLSESPSQVQASKHVYGLLSHMVYGLTLGAVHNKTRNLL